MMSVIDALASSPTLFIVCSLVLGSIFGSFLNVVIYRMPIMLDRQWRTQYAELAQAAPPSAQPPTFNLLTPRSSCPSCKTPIKARHNVPILSYLLLRGRCASCKASISVRYLLVEALTGVLSAIVAWK